MISFFRHIRQNLVNEHKTVKYFKYAIGEFLLIVAGILVALQIQNWNEGRLDRLKEAEYLRNLMVEMNGAKAEFLDDQTSHEAGMVALESLLLQFDNRTASDTEIVDWSRLSLGATPMFFPPSAVLDDLIASGNLQLISSSELRLAINTYSQEKDRLRFVQEIRLEEVFNQTRPFLGSRMNRFKDVQPPGIINELLDSVQFESYLAEHLNGFRAHQENWIVRMEAAMNQVITLLHADPRSKPQDKGS